jgi:thioredoxin 1
MKTLLLKFSTSWVALLCSTVLLCGCGTEKSKSSVASVDYYATYQNDSLSSVIRQEIAKSQRPVLYFYADWCGPCRRFRESLDDEQVQKALAKTTLIKINIDKDQMEYAAKYGIEAVPSFVRVNEAGEPQGLITSDAWGDEDVPESIAPVMGQFTSVPQ